MRAGKLRHRVAIEAPTPDVDQASGEEDQLYSVVAERWAKVEQLGGSEQQGGQQIQSFATHRVTLRWFQGLGVRNRFSWEGRFLGVLSVTEDEKKQMQVCDCREVK